jgi:hypothetical protein
MLRRLTRKPKQTSWLIASSVQNGDFDLICGELIDERHQGRQRQHTDIWNRFKSAKIV